MQVNTVIILSGSSPDPKQEPYVAEYLIHQLMSGHVNKREKTRENLATWSFPPPTKGRRRGTKCTDEPRLHLTYRRLLISQRETDVTRCQILKGTMVIINWGDRETEGETSRERQRGWEGLQCT